MSNSASIMLKPILILFEKNFEILSVAQLVMSIGAYLGCNGIKQLGSKKKKKCWE